MPTSISPVAAATGTVGAPIIGAEPDYVEIDFAPPAPRKEAVASPPAGYNWSPGFWNWTGHKHVWVAGRHIREREGYHWVADRWDQRGTRWRYAPGHWELSSR